MIESDVEARLAAALESRRGQRDFVEEFVHAWEGFDTVISSNDSQRDFVNLCGPSQRANQPDVVDGGGARLAVELSLITEVAGAVAEAGSRLSDIGEARRLRPLAAHSATKRG